VKFKFGQPFSSQCEKIRLMYLLLAGSDTVLILMWCGGDLYLSKCRLHRWGSGLLLTHLISRKIFTWPRQKTATSLW